MQTQTNVRVRYSETDQMGIAHHSNYAVWFEVGRTDFLNKLGISYTKIEASGILLPLYEINCKFKSPARYEDDIIIKTTIKTFTRIRVFFSYEIVNAVDGKLIAAGETMHAWTDKSLKLVNAEALIPEVYSLLNQVKS